MSDSISSSNPNHKNLEKGKKWCNELIERDYNIFLKNINYQ